MECKTRELTISLMPNNVIVSEFNNNITELSIEGVEETLEVLREFNTINERPKGGVAEMPSFYVNKKIIKMYTTTDVLIPVALGLVANSFASKLVGNLFLTLRARFGSSTQDYPIRVLSTKKEAIEWVKGHIESATTVTSF
ncbi:MAG: Unknown protein [uncultured Aureispira sp.]|uniref:STAS/SEC14 domain-containing protein n=1 Tax=uncultured Aureispira sp. TaxID=1331704 RepID=A0A6S6SP15_9BACT|nr:MAG: Unknown protein [uncultured Aureispira sp.]